VGEHRRRWVGMHHGEGLGRQGCGSHGADKIEKASTDYAIGILVDVDQIRAITATQAVRPTAMSPNAAG
jgi:hypothetical protein